METKEYPKDFEKLLFEYQEKFYRTLKNENLIDLYFTLKEYIIILCNFKRIVNSDEKYFISESLSIEIIEKILSDSFKIDSAWKNYILKRMNYYIHDYQSSISLDDEILKNYIDNREYSLLNIDFNKNLIIIRYIKSVINTITDLICNFFDNIDSEIFMYYFYLTIFNKDINCTKLIKDETLKSIVIYAYNLYNYKLKFYLLYGYN